MEFNHRGDSGTQGIRDSLVIPTEARDLQFAAKCRSLASLGMTNYKNARLALPPVPAPAARHTAETPLPAPAPACGSSPAPRRPSDDRAPRRSSAKSAASPLL